MPGDVPIKDQGPGIQHPVHDFVRSDVAGPQEHSMKSGSRYEIQEVRDLTSSFLASLAHSPEWKAIRSDVAGPQEHSMTHAMRNEV